MDDEDYFIDDVIGSVKKRKLNSKDKGQRGERDLCKILSERFKESFFRVVGSGNRWSHVALTENAKEVFTGDVVCPPNFRFTIECKYGYENIELFNVFSGSKELDKFLEQADKDARMVGKMPMLCWKKPRQGWIVFFKETEVDSTYKLKYRNWTAVSLVEALKYPNSFYLL